MHLHRQIGERGDHGVAGAREVETELGMAVQRAPQRHRAWLDTPSVRMQSVDRGTR